jgi:hypothetical protein
MPAPIASTFCKAHLLSSYIVLEMSDPDIGADFGHTEYICSILSHNDFLHVPWCIQQQPANCLSELHCLLHCTQFWVVTRTATAVESMYTLSALLVLCISNVSPKLTATNECLLVCVNTYETSITFTIMRTVAACWPKTVARTHCALCLFQTGDVVFLTILVGRAWLTDSSIKN